MNEANNAGDTAVPIARIEAQDAVFAQPLQEYLESHGCRVVVNSRTTTDPHYVVCVGDTDFVKAFFELREYSAAKNLAVIYEGDEDDLASLRQHGVRYYFVDPKQLSERDVRDIFAFFFTGKAKSKVNRKEPTATKKKSVIPTQPTREHETPQDTQHVSDVQRIADTLQQVFHTKKRAGKSTQPPHRAPRYLAWLTSGLLVMFMPFFLYGASIGVGTALLVASGKTMRRGDVRWTNALLGYSNSYLQAARLLVHLGSPAFLLVGQGGIVEDQDRLLSILADVSKVESGVLSIFATSRTVAGGILFPEDTAHAAGLADVTKLTTDVSLVSQHLALVSAQLDSLRNTPRFPFQTKMFSRLANRGISALTQIRDIVGYTEKLLTLYPRMGGFRRKQTYLVLLQNSMELRPTGGFIGSLLLVSFADGRVEKMEVQDVYTADGQLKGHVDPPLPIREILGNEHWYLRDSNWDPDFSLSGERAVWFYEKEMNQTVDGVIAVSLPLVTKLLGVTGPIELLDFNERISESNFFAKSLLYTQTDFFPGSTQKKDFLGALTNALLTRVTTDRSLSAGELLRVMTASIRSRDIQFYFTDQQLQSLIHQWDWGGKVEIGSCEAVSRQIPCIGDGFGLIEANLGVNKSNFFVSREALSQITIDLDGTIEHAMTMKIKNDAPIQQDGSGSYQVYSRILVPSDSEVSEVSVDGVLVPVREASVVVPPPAPYWFLEPGERNSVIHVPLAVPPGEIRQLSVSWIERNKLVFDDSVLYQLTIRKQPGISEIPWNVVVRYPEVWDSSIEGGIAKGSNLEYNTTLESDAKMRVIFQKNL